MPKGIYDHSKQRIYKGNGKERRRQTTRKWRENNPEYHREYFGNHKKEINGRIRNSYHSDLKRSRKMHNARALAQKYSNLAKFCELCPEDDKRSATIRHHPDYEEPFIIVSVCDRCHKFAECD